MRRAITAAAAAVIAATAAPSAASATELIAGLYLHDIDDGISIGHSAERGQEVIVGLRSEPIGRLGSIRRPQAHLLIATNTWGGIGFAAAGLSWRFDLVSDRFYVRPGIGVAIHTGETALPSPNEPGISAAERSRRFRAFAEHLDLGSRVLFEPELALGWQATERLGVELSWVHLSHAQLAGKQNPGLGELGLRAVYRFTP